MRSCHSQPHGSAAAFRLSARVSRLAGDPQDARADRGEGSEWREPEAAARFNAESLANRLLRLALDVTAAHQARPDEIGSPLVPGEQRVPAADVLPETQLAARPQHPPEFGQRRGDV